ncbi:MAG: hypothetical protein EOO54_21430 [Haliea sp.]|nr:MAG: hypothetical protein EOO54_21430 [Haliea sp.]
MRFHLSMFLMVVFVSMAMHAMATAATPTDAARFAQQDAGVRDAGKTLNESLKSCREQARLHPKASKRDRQVCERSARRDFRRDVKRARLDTPQAQ